MRYASINSHKNFEVSRRDDLEALLYMMVFLYKGELPWQGLTGQTQAEKSKQMGKNTCQRFQMCSKSNNFGMLSYREN